MDGMLTCRVMVNLTAWNISTVIVQVADHPFILACELEVCLPQVVAVRPFESTFTPNLSRSLDRIVQPSLDEGSMDCVVTNRDYAFAPIILEVTFNLAWAPMLLPSKLEYEIHRSLRCLLESVRSPRLDRKPVPPIFPVEAPPTIDGSLIDLEEHPPCRGSISSSGTRTLTII